MRHQRLHGLQTGATRMGRGSRAAGWRRLLPAIPALLLALCQSFTPLPPAGASIDRRIDLIHRQREIEVKKDEARERLRHIKREKKVRVGELRRIESHLRQVGHQLAQTSRRLRTARDELDETTQNLRAAIARLSDHRDAMANRLVAIYELGDVKYLDVLVHAASFADFANRAYQVRLMVDQDLGLMRAMEEEQRRVEAYRARVEVKEQQIAELQQEVSARHLEVAEDRQAKARVVSSLIRQRAYWERALAAMEQDSRDISAQIRRYQRTALGRRRYSIPWTGSFLRPVNGGITSGFGSRIHPILGVRKMHTGVDISAATGVPIRAADGGTVIWAARRGGYGNCVVLDHGGGMSTVYGHCSQLRVSAGQEVRKGEVIGLVGSTGLSTGPHLHFEVRRNGSPVNPLGY